MKLMRTAFKPESGRLSDSKLDSGEQVGMMGIVRRRNWNFQEPIEPPAGGLRRSDRNE